MANNYKDTLNLPRTDFAMKAGLVQNEPTRLAKWQAGNLYERVQQQHAGDPIFMLHDGPPFANGDIHMGHLTNKTLKDVVLRFKTMQGHRTPYVPGWDCHGLPIEHKIQQKLGSKLREMSQLEVRKLCFDYADKYCGLQSEQFQRLGILGDWAHPYRTMDAAYEAQVLDVFARFVERGLVYKQLKPVHWSIANQTALADAELEYQDVTDTAVFVEFPSANPGAMKARFDLKEPATPHYMIWTTTPWTLPANMAIAVGPDVEYAFVKYAPAQGERERLAVVASALVEKVFKGRAEPTVLKTVRGSELVEQEYLHPLVEGRSGRLLPADYVTTTDGTGLVHTAPGHGEDDYATGRKFGIETYCPVQANGRYDSTVPNFLAGLTVWEANPVVVEKLAELGVLFAAHKYEHSYPHDWRSKTPTIFRATEQWFVRVDGTEPSLREQALSAVAETKFTPEWGRARLLGMLQNRPDWTLSRQRAWGLPIPVFYNEQGEPLLTPESVRAVAKTFAERGSNAWYELSPKELLGDYAPPAGFNVETLRKEGDIFDVWFESGSSWHAVLDARDDLPDAPADLYLEGSDQHRGWFQLSLLSSLGATSKPPYKAVLTHGFIVKPDGTKVSKSDKEYVTAMQEVNTHGADLLRLFVCSLDYTGDMAASPAIIKEFGDKYRKVRNTIRYCLSNLYDVERPKAEVGDAAADDLRPSSFGLDSDFGLRPSDFSSLDAWMLHRLDTLIRDVVAAYDSYATHKAFRLMHDFCNVEVSSIYANAMKDRLYCDKPDSPARRRCQFVLHRTAEALVKLLAPMLVFTADEAWEHLPHQGDDQSLDSVHLASLPKPLGIEQRPEWSLLMMLRDEALMQLDKLKKDAGLNKASDAEAVYQLDAATKAMLAPYGEDLADLIGAGFATIEDGKNTIVLRDRRADLQACARSWKRRPDVGSDPSHPELSARDAAAVG